MALLFVDGFDHYATGDIAKKWTASSSGSISATSGRRDGGYLLGTYGHSTYKTFSSSHTTVTLGFAFQPTYFHDGYPAILTLREGSNVHLTLAINTNAKLFICRGNAQGSVLATGNIVLSTNIWYYIEFKATINDSAGATEVRVNGIADSALTLSSVDTRNGGTYGVIDTLELGQSSGNNGMWAKYDDLYFCDSSGSTNNDFLGDCRVDTIYPTGAGNYTQFTPSSGSNYSCVDETAPNTSDYVSDATSGHRDSYAFGNLTALTSQTVYGVQINAYAKKSDAGSRSLGTMSRLSGANKDGSGVALSDTSYAYVAEIQETDPASAAWTESNVNAAEFGVKVTA